MTLIQFLAVSGWSRMRRMDHPTLKLLFMLLMLLGFGTYIENSIRIRTAYVLYIVLFVVVVFVIPF